MSLDIIAFKEGFVNEGECDWLFNPGKIRKIFKKQMNMSDAGKEE